MAAADGFDFCGAMRRLCNDAVARTPELSHVRMDQIAVVYAQARRRVLHGLQAKLTPLRFENGSLTTRRGSTTWTVRRMFVGEHELFYILTFYLPRFLDQPLEEKLVTVFHELFHISPRFDGDIRRLEGRYHVHSHSQKEYDREMAVFAKRYLDAQPNDTVWGFLRDNFRTLHSRHNGVVGLKLPIPRLIPLNDRRSA